jgi:hypothetical protein
VDHNSGEWGTGPGRFRPGRRFSGLEVPGLDCWQVLRRKISPGGATESSRVIQTLSHGTLLVGTSVTRGLPCGISGDATSILARRSASLSDQVVRRTDLPKAAPSAERKCSSPYGLPVGSCRRIACASDNRPIPPHWNKSTTRLFARFKPSNRHHKRKCAVRDYHVGLHAEEFPEPQRALV